MWEQIFHIDQQIFELINRTWANGFFDWFLVLMRNKFVWGPLYLFVVAFSLFNFRKGWIIVLLLAAVFGTGDALSSRIIKKTVKRTRPCKEVNLQPAAIHRIPSCNGFSFTSSHATNHFAIATFIGLTFWSLRKWIFIVGILWAFIICYAQVYVGVHYPFDVLCGSILGFFIGLFYYVIGRHLKVNLD